MYGEGRLVSSLKSQIYLDNKGKLFYLFTTVYRVLYKKDSVFLLLMLENIFFSAGEIRRRLIYFSCSSAAISH